MEILKTNIQHVKSIYVTIWSHVKRTYVLCVQTDLICRIVIVTAPFVCFVAASIAKMQQVKKRQARTSETCFFPEKTKGCTLRFTYTST